MSLVICYDSSFVPTLTYLVSEADTKANEAILAELHSGCAHPCESCPHCEMFHRYYTEEFDAEKHELEMLAQCVALHFEYQIV